MVLFPFLCLHSLVYWTNHYLGYSVPLNVFVGSVNSIEKLQDLIVNAGMHILLILHGAFAMAYGFDANYLLTNTAPYSYPIISHYGLEIVYYTFDLLKLIIVPSVQMRSDFLFHHCVSYLLLIVSYLTNYVHIGLLTMTILNSTNLMYDMFSYTYLTRNNNGQRLISNIAFFGMFLYVRIYVLFQGIIKPILYSFIYQRYSLLTKMFFGPALCSLYGLQFLWCYRLAGVLKKNFMNYISDPSVIVYIPNGLLLVLNPNLITYKEAILETDLEPPPMDEGLENLLVEFKKWEDNLKQYLNVQGTEPVPSGESLSLPSISESNSEVISDTDTDNTVKYISSTTTDNDNNNENENEPIKDQVQEQEQKEKKLVSEIQPIVEEEIATVHEDVQQSKFVSHPILDDIRGFTKLFENTKKNE